MSYNENQKKLNLPNIERNAVWLAPSFTHKFDFSDETQFDAWAKLAFKGAVAIATEAERLLNEARAKDAQEQVKIDAIEAQRLRDNPPPQPAALAPDSPSAPV